MIMKKQANPIDVLCIGQSSVDIFCDTLKRIPDAGEFCLIDHISMFPGGCPTNTAIVTSRLGLKTALVTAMGRDNLGKFLLNELESAGILTQGITLLDHACSGKCVILLVEGDDRRLIFQNGANEYFNKTHIDKSLVERAHMLFLSSYPSGLPNLNQHDLLDLFRYARDFDVTVVMDILIDYREKNALEKMEVVLPCVDYLLLNRDEGAMLTGEEKYELQSRALIDRGGRNVVVKLGSEGSYMRGRDIEFRGRPYRVDVKDPTGAGDCFNGGFMYGLIRGWDMKKTLLFANLAGASAVTELGCTTGIYSLDKLLSRLAEFEREYEYD
jgi:sugar/nucleoside kinase (ribokinase family)